MMSNNMTSNKRKSTGMTDGDGSPLRDEDGGKLLIMRCRNGTTDITHNAAIAIANALQEPGMRYC